MTSKSKNSQRTSQPGRPQHKGPAMNVIFEFDSDDETIYLNLREIQAISDLKYTEDTYGVEVYDDGFKRHFSVGGGTSAGSFKIHMKGKDSPLKILHSGNRLQGKAETLAMRAGEKSLTADQKKFPSMHVDKVAAYMNAQPNTFVSARKFKKDYKALIKDWKQCIGALQAAK